MRVLTDGATGRCANERLGSGRAATTLPNGHRRDRSWQRKIRHGDRLSVMGRYPTATAAQDRLRTELLTSGLYDLVPLAEIESGDHR
jgi:hypothetical protein